MKLFVGICMALSMSQLNFQVSGQLYDPWGIRMDKIRQEDQDRPRPIGPIRPEAWGNGGWKSGSMVTDSDSPPQTAPIAYKKPAKKLPELFKRPLPVKFVVKGGRRGNIEKVEVVYIKAGRRLPRKLQQVLNPTPGYITVVYRNYLGLLTRIEKIRLPAHLPKETIPVDGLVIKLIELPWEPSINPLEFEEDEVDNEPSDNNENLSQLASRVTTTPAPLMTIDGPLRLNEYADKLKALDDSEILQQNGLKPNYGTSYQLSTSRKKYLVGGLL